MSVIYWMCEGIGVEQAALLPMLDPIKIFRYMKTEMGIKFEKGILDGYAVDLSRDEQFKALDNLCCEHELSQHMMSVLKFSDWKSSYNALEACDDNNGRYFLLYPPRYPWNPTGELISEQDVRNYICDTVLPFCNEGINRQQIMYLGVVN